MKIRVQELRDYLVDEGLVRYEGTAGTDPVCYLDLPGGAPSPADEGEDVVVYLKTSGGFAGRRFTGYGRDLTVDIHIRCTTDGLALAHYLAMEIDNRLTDEENITLNTLDVELSQVLAPFDLVPVSDPEAGLYFVGKYAFFVRREALNQP